MSVHIIGRSCEQRILPVCGTNNNRLIGSASDLDRPSAILGVRAAVKNQLIARLERICDTLELFIRPGCRRVDNMSDTIGNSAADQHDQHAHTEIF